MKVSNPVPEGAPRLPDRKYLILVFPEIENAVKNRKSELKMEV